MPQRKPKVIVIERSGKNHYYMRYRDGSRTIERSTGVLRKGAKSRKEAEKAAAKWEAELEEDRYRPQSRMTWDDFRAYYVSSILDELRPATIVAITATLSAFEELCRPAHVSDLTPAMATTFRQRLGQPYTVKCRDGSTRERQRSKATVAKHLRHLQAAANWAASQSLLAEAPKLASRKGQRSVQTRMKGRPITLEEFERILDVTPRVVGDDAAESWRLVLRLLWASGLRISEAAALRWDHVSGGVSVELDGRGSVLRFDADSQKSGKDELAPLAPEAVELLEPIAKKTGYVLNPQTRDGSPFSRDSTKWTNVISAIGKKAGVVTDAAKGKTATAHDFRRAFGDRWSRRVMPAQLMALMRHSSVDVTMAFYRDKEAKSIARGFWTAIESVAPKPVELGDYSGDPAQAEAERLAKEPRIS